MLEVIVPVKLHSSVKHILRPAIGLVLCWMMPAVKMMAAFRAKHTFNVNQNVVFSQD